MRQELHDSKQVLRAYAEPPRGLSEDADGLELAHGLGERLWYPHRLTPLASPKHFVFSATTVTLGAVTIGTLRYSSAVRIDTDAYETSFQVNVPTMGEFRTAVGDRVVRATTGRAAVYGPDVPTAISGWENPCVMLAVKLDRNDAERGIERYFGTEFSSFLPLPSELDVSFGAGLEWVEFLRRIIGLAREIPSMDKGLVQYFSERCIDGLAACLLASSGDSSPSVETLSRDAVGRAREVIEYAAGPPLSLEMLSTIAGVSGRSLQLSFRRTLGISPMQYQRRERLRRVYDTLAAAGPSIGIVREVAVQHGFTHMGRFSEQYHRVCGELPSQTLGRTAATRRRA